MVSNWLQDFLARRGKNEIHGKGARLGKFDSQPMLTTILDLHGLNARDAVEVVQRKLSRALLAGAKEVKVLYDEKDRKLKRSLHQFLSEHTAVKSFEDADDAPGITIFYL